MFVKKSQAYPIFFRCWRVSRAIMNMVTLHGFQRFKNISDLTILLYEKTWKIHLHLKLKPFYELRDISTGTSHSFISFAWGILWEFDKYFWLTVLGSQKYLPSCYSLIPHGILMRVFDVCFEMQGGSKNYYPFGERIFELLNTIKSLGQRCSLVSKT